MEFVSSQLSTLPSLPISDVPIGIGITKSVLLALKDGFSMLIKFVSQFLINVNLTLIMETALLALRDMT